MTEATTIGPKQRLQRYLTAAREALLWKLDGLDEYDVRRPLTPTGTNLLGLVKHVGGVSAEYLGSVFDRPFPEPMPWFADDAEDNAHMWATAEESRADIVGFYERVWVHADATIEALDLDAPGEVPWWGEQRRDAAPDPGAPDRRDQPPRRPRGHPARAARRRGGAPAAHLEPAGAGRSLVGRLPRRVEQAAKEASGRV